MLSQVYVKASSQISGEAQEPPLHPNPQLTALVHPQLGENLLNSVISLSDKSDSSAWVLIRQSSDHDKTRVQYLWSLISLIVPVLPRHWRPREGKGLDASSLSSRSLHSHASFELPRDKAMELPVECSAVPSCQLCCCPASMPCGVGVGDRLFTE